MNIQLLVLDSLDGLKYGMFMLLCVCKSHQNMMPIVSHDCVSVTFFGSPTVNKSLTVALKMYENLHTLLFSFGK